MFHFILLLRNLDLKLADFSGLQIEMEILYMGTNEFTAYEGDYI